MNSEAVDQSLSALADPTRTRIVRLIRDSDDGRAGVSALAATLGLRQPTVSHHMGVLRSQGLVRREPEGRRVWYSIDPDQEDRVVALLGETDRQGAHPDDLDRIVDDLAHRYRGDFGRETVQRYVTESYEMLTAREQTPLLASRASAFASQRLDDLVRQATRPATTPSVLFVCVQNAGRSQMAAGILRHLAGDRVMVRTAGSAPASDLRSSVVAALDEIGVPVGGEFPKPLTDDAVRGADYVITMGCGDACPIYPGRRYLDWEIADPVGKPMTVVRSIRDDIDQRVRALLPELLEPVAPRTEA